jgi:hypothetical protein
MDGVQARKVFDLLVAAGYSPSLSAERDEEKDDTAFSVTVDVASFDAGALSELTAIGDENGYRVDPDRNVTLYFDIDEDEEGAGEGEPEPVEAQKMEE